MRIPRRALPALLALSLGLIGAPAHAGGGESSFWPAHSRGRIGVEVLPMSRQLREAMGVDPDAGVLVGRVDPEGPAAEGGLRAGDVIVRFGERAVTGPRSLIRAVRQAPEGSSIALEVVRKGEPLELQVQPRGTALPRWDSPIATGEQVRRLEHEIRELRERVEALEKSHGD